MSEIIPFRPREQPALPPVSDAWLDRQAVRRCSQIEVAAYSVAAGVLLPRVVHVTPQERHRLTRFADKLGGALN